MFLDINGLKNRTWAQSVPPAIAGGYEVEALILNTATSKKCDHGNEQRRTNDRPDDREVSGPDSHGKEFWYPERSSEPQTDNRTYKTQCDRHETTASRESRNRLPQ